MSDDELFTTKMKRATRKAHAVSDALVNAKLLFALNSNSVWVEGLLIFYEIFKFLEFAMEVKRDENLGKLFIREMSRTAAFEDDLQFYLGDDWQNDYEIRPTVRQYLNHLKDLFERDSDLLMAYVYHLYMGLLSGGQILRKKRELERRVTGLTRDRGEAVTVFIGETISNLKTRLRDRMNAIADTLDENKKKALIEESKMVFELNNMIIKSVRGVEKIAVRNACIFIGCFLLIIAIVSHYVSLVMSPNNPKSLI